MTLREALVVLLKDESIGDFIYSVRERAATEGDEFSGSSWDHPRVKRFSDAVVVLEGELKRLTEEAA